MPLTKERKAELREEWEEHWHKGSADEIYPIPEKAADWWLSKLSSLLEEERKRVSEGMEKMKLDIKRPAKFTDGHRSLSMNKAEMISYNAAISNIQSLINNPESR